MPHCARDGPDAVTSWHPYPLLAAQGLSLAADSVLRPVVDWFGAADVRLSRRLAPRDPWRVRWGPEHTSVVLPPVGYEEEALDKMIADGSQGVIFLPHDSLTRVQERATAHAAVRIDLAAHPDARVDARTSAPVTPTTGMSVFLVPRTGNTVRVFPTYVHEMWRQRLPTYATPLRLQVWQEALRWHPDSDFVHDVLSGIEFGRPMGYTGDRLLQRDCRNPAAHEVNQPQLRNIRSAEFEQGWRAGPFPCVTDAPQPMFNLMCHPTKAVFKRFSPKIRQVVNISHPHDESAVNRNILRTSRLKNSSFEQAASVAARLGAGTLMWKMDVTSAYKLIAALPQDWHLTGELEWIGGVKHYSFSTTTCFGSSSSADTFHDLGCAAEFIIRLSVANVVICRYADDFIVFIPPLPTGPDHAHAAATRDRIICVCEALGLPIAKFEGPSSRLVFLGTGIDTDSMRVFVPEQRLAFVLGLLRDWRTKRSAKVRDILSLAGQLSFLTRVVRWGSPHIAQLFALGHAGRSLGAHVTLPQSLGISLQWWIDALTASPWSSLLAFVPFVHTAVVETDASMDGIGAFCPTSSHWFSHRLTGAELASAMRAKSRAMGELELRAIAMAVATFAESLSGSALLCITDNAEADLAINRRSSKMPKIRHLINFIGIISHQHHIRVQSRLVKRDDNWRADLLSKHQVDAFLARTPGAALYATTPQSVPILP